jgi:hypothetical protein
MRSRIRQSVGRVVAVLLLASSVLTACRSVMSVEYEYEEEIYLSLDGSATVYVNASVPALVALRGVDLDVDPRARLDRNDVRAFFESPVAEVDSVTTSRRNNRRYVHVRLDVPDIRRLGQSRAFSWASYSLIERDGVLVYRQELGPASARSVGDVGWTGDEMVAVRLHLPSRVPFHNAAGRTIERGNIIRWEQRLTDRIAGDRLAIEVHMEPESILVQTLALFAAMVVAALSTLALVIWWIVRKGRGTALPGVVGDPSRMRHAPDRREFAVPERRSRAEASNPAAEVDASVRPAQAGAGDDHSSRVELRD